MKHAVITGATSGIGLAAARELADKGWRVIGVGRDPGRCAAAEAELRSLAPLAKPVYLVADLASRRQVLELAARLRYLLMADNGGRLEALLHNAATVPAWYTVTEDGYETQFAVNHLSGFLLARELEAELVRAAGRIVTTSSASHRGARMRWADPMFRRLYNPLAAYGQSKLANVLFTIEHNRRKATATGVRAFAVDPGLVDTAIGEKGGGIVALVWKWRRRGGVAPEVAARTLVALAARELEGNDDAPYWKDLAPIRPSPRALDEADGRRLWELSDRLCGAVSGEGGPR